MSTGNLWQCPSFKPQRLTFPHYLCISTPTRYPPATSTQLEGCGKTSPPPTEFHESIIMSTCRCTLSWCLILEHAFPSHPMINRVLWATCTVLKRDVYVCLNMNATWEWICCNDANDLSVLKRHIFPHVYCLQMGLDGSRPGSCLDNWPQLSVHSHTALIMSVWANHKVLPEHDANSARSQIIRIVHNYIALCFFGGIESFNGALVGIAGIPQLQFPVETLCIYRHNTRVTLTRGSPRSYSQCVRKPQIPRLFVYLRL